MRVRESILKDEQLYIWIRLQFKFLDDISITPDFELKVINTHQHEDETKIILGDKPFHLIK